MTSALMIGLVGMIVFVGAVRQKEVYASFLRGASRGMHSAAQLLPALCGMLLLLRLIEASGLMEAAVRLMRPLLEMADIPAELTTLILFRPLSGSGSLAALGEIFDICGVDSRAGRIASALVGSSETIFYTLTVYASAAGVRRAPGALAASLCGYVAGVIVCICLIR